MRWNRLFAPLLFVVPVVALFACAAVAQAPSTPPAKMKVLLISGVNNHNWQATTPLLREMLERTGKFEVRVNEEMTGTTADTFANYDVLVMNWNDWKKSRGKWWGDAAQQALLEYVRSGKGLVAVHAANNAFWGWEEFDKLVGGTWRDRAGHAPIHTYTVDNKAADDPIMKGIPAFQVTDELYHNLDIQPNIHVLGTAFDDPKNCGKDGKNCGNGKNEPLIWTVNYGQGRVFQTALGHDVNAMKAPGFIATLQRGTEWAATGKVTIAPPESFQQ